MSERTEREAFEAWLANKAPEMTGESDWTTENIWLSGYRAAPANAGAPEGCVYVKTELLAEYNAMKQERMAHATHPADHSGDSVEMVAIGDLHSAIMNLRCVEPAEYQDAAVRMAYRVGHRDARHAAAELAAPPADHSEHARHMVAGAAAVAWVHEDDPARVISAAQKAQALRDGGASASSVRPYSIAAYTAHAPSASPAALMDEWKKMVDAAHDKAAAALAEEWGIDVMALRLDTISNVPWRYHFARALLTARPAEPAAPAAPIYQLQRADGSWIDQPEHSYRYNVSYGHTVRIVYVAPAIPAETARADRQGVALSVTGDEVRAIVRAAHPGGSDHPSGPDYVMATVAYLNRRASSSGAEVEIPEGFADAVWREICELPDRNSPEDEPEACVCTYQEFTGCVERAMESLTAAKAPNAEKASEI